MADVEPEATPPAEEGATAESEDTLAAQAVYDIPVEVTAVLGTASMPISQILKLGRGAVVELDRGVGEAIDLVANNVLIAQGEVVVVEDRLAVTMTEIIKSNIGKL